MNILHKSPFLQKINISLKKYKLNIVISIIITTLSLAIILGFIFSISNDNILSLYYARELGLAYANKNSQFSYEGRQFIIGNIKNTYWQRITYNQYIIKFIGISNIPVDNSSTFEMDLIVMPQKITVSKDWYDGFLNSHYTYGKLSYGNLGSFGNGDYVAAFKLDSDKTFKNFIGIKGTSGYDNVYYYFYDGTKNAYIPYTFCIIPAPFSNFGDYDKNIVFDKVRNMSWYRYGIHITQTSPNDYQYLYLGYSKDTPNYIQMAVSNVPSLEDNFDFQIYHFDYVYFTANRRISSDYGNFYIEVR